MTPETILAFWFAEENRPLWFRSTADFDQMVRDRFEPLWVAARNGDLDDWQDTPHGALALVIILDQFPLNMFRGKPESFSTEAMSREIAARAIARQFDQSLSNDEKLFLYMPYMHSEDEHDQDRCVALFEAAGMVDNIRWGNHHRDIVRRFGRFPHRNEILGRPSTDEEKAWLASDEAFHG